jgi:hypothetical protein
MELSISTVDGLEGLVLEDEWYRMLVLPQVGGKMASVVCRETGREIMYRHPDRPFRPPVYGGAFGDYDISGFDDAFPTLAEGVYPEYPWKGVMLPDHGEVWTIPWQWEFSDGELHLWTYGVRLPYRLDRWISALDGAIVLRYCATNLSAFEIRCMYAAHCLLAVTPRMRVLLPPDIRVRIDWSKHARLGTVLTEHPWPVTRDTHGDEVDLSVMASDEAGFADKYFTTKVREGYCALHDPTAGDFVGFKFSPRELPYVGVWINQGGWPLDETPVLHAALEPCTGCPDRLDIAIQRGEADAIPALGERQWTLRLLAGRSTDALAIFAAR